MGKQGKKKRMIEKRRRSKRRRKASLLPKPTASFPLDLTSEILLRLPAKSVARFRCVSKLWSSITTQPCFIKSFVIRPSKEPSFLLFFKGWGKMFVFSFPHQNSDSDESHSYSQPLYSYQMTRPKGCSFFSTDSVHGLICFRKNAQPIIWNPTTREFFTLREPEKSWENIIVVFLGYDPIEGKHKVVCMPSYQSCDECRVLTLGSAQESWRSIKHNQKHRPFTDSWRCINGVLYYKAVLDGSDVCILMSFDVRSEKFDMIELPQLDSRSMLIPYKGRLGCVINKTLLVLEDATEHIWSCKHSIAPYVDDYDQNMKKTTFIFSGISHAGEFIYVPYRLSSSFYISYFDPKRNSSRKVEFKGIADDVFKRTNGLGDICVPYTFSNHIESLISL